MDICLVYECIGEVIGVPLPQLAAWACAGCFGLAGVLIVVFRRWG